MDDVTAEQAQQTLEQMKKALAAGGETTGEGAQQLSRKLSNGKYFAWVESNPLTNKQLDDHNAVADYIAEHIGEVYTIIESGQSVYIGDDLPGEYTQSQYTSYLKNKKRKLLRSKNKAIDGFGDMIEIATNRRWEQTKHPGNKDAKYGMYRYDSSFAFPIKDSSGNVQNVRAFDVELVIRNASDGKKYLYDIVNIKENTAAAFDLEKQARQGGNKSATQGGVSNTNNTQNSNSVNNQNSLKLTDQERVKNADTAEQYFGTTINPKIAGYLDVNGKMLDFSGRKFGAPGNYRSVDHREITDAFENYGGDGYSDGMVQFMSEGNIRLSPESGGINLSVKPNKVQEEQLARYIRAFGGEVIVDLGHENGDIAGSVEYPARTPASLIVQEIRDYFDKGKLPENFDYSRKIIGNAVTEQEAAQAIENIRVLDNLILFEYTESY